MSMVPAGIFDDDFLLDSELARTLFHGYAANEPILDFHCHLSASELASDHRFRSLTELWLAADPTKWRAMRANGVAEYFCTGPATDFEKFSAWAQTVPKTLRNPLWIWTHLELKRSFGIERRLDADSAREIFEAANLALIRPGFHARGLVERAGAVVVCTTDDPADALEHHQAHAQSNAAARLALYPTFRADAAFAVHRPEDFRAWLARLGSAVGTPVRSYDELVAALDQRHAYFHRAGCRLSDHGLERMHAEDFSLADARAAFDAAAAGIPVLGAPAELYRSALLYELSVLDHSRGWTQQFHLGALRDTNSRMLAQLGADTGFDSIGDFAHARPLARFLDRLDQKDQLARTILYNSNPHDNELFASMLGNFQDGSFPGKLQLGSASWQLNHPSGVERQLDALSDLGLLSRFVGIASDARSFLSLSRHEYFRRVLCGMLGRDAERGLVPNDEALLGELVRDLSFRNARDYLGLALPPAAVS